MPRDHETMDAGIGAAARAAEAERVIWPHYCRKVKASVTREQCLDKYRMAQSMDFGPCQTCPTGRGLYIEHRVKGMLTTPPRAQKRPKSKSPIPEVGKGVKMQPRATLARQEGISVHPPESVRVLDEDDGAISGAVGQEPAWMPTGEELQAAGIGQGEDIADPFATCQFKDAESMGRPSEPAISLYPSGDIGLTKGAMERFRHAPYVKLYFDPDSRTLAIKPLAEYEAGALKIGKGGKGGSTNNRISGASYIKRFGITDRPKGVPLVFSPTHGLWCARLPREGK